MVLRQLRGLRGFFLRACARGWVRAHTRMRACETERNKTLPTLAFPAKPLISRTERCEALRRDPRIDPRITLATATLEALS